MAPIEEVPELVSPEEGFSTLSAQIPRQSVDHITRIIRRQRGKGISPTGGSYRGGALKLTGRGSKKSMAMPRYLGISY